MIPRLCEGHDEGKADGQAEEDGQTEDRGSRRV